MSGRLLCYVAPHTLGDLAVVNQAAALTGAHDASGLVVRGRLTHQVLRRFGRESGQRRTQQPVVVDPGVWTTTIATPSAPLGLLPDEDVLVPLTLSEWAESWLSAGADGVLTPLKFVPSGD